MNIGSKIVYCILTILAALAFWFLPFNNHDFTYYLIVRDWMSGESFLQSVLFAFFILPIVAFLLCPLTSSKGMSIIMSIAMLVPALYAFIESEEATLPIIVYTILVSLGVLTTIILNVGYTPEEENSLQKKLPEERSYDDAKLEGILKNPESYHPEFIAKCQRELEIRNASKSLIEKVTEFDDTKIEEILSNTDIYSLALIYSCKQEQQRRKNLKAEELKKQAEEQRRIFEQQEKERKKRRAAWWNKWKIYVIIFSTISFIYFGNLFTNINLIKQYNYFYDRIVVQKKTSDIDSTTITTIKSICDRVIQKPFIAKKHKGNAYHLKSYLNEDSVNLSPNAELLSKAMEFKSPLATAEIAMQVLLGDGGTCNEDDRNSAIKTLQNLNTLEADIILAAFEFVWTDYSKAYEILSKHINKSKTKFKTDRYIMEYDESDCLTTIGYNMLGVIYYYGFDIVDQSVEKAKYYLNYNHLLNNLSNSELADYKPSTHDSYFYRIHAQVYEIIGDLLFLGYTHDKYKNKYLDKNFILNFTYGSYNFYSAANYIAPLFLDYIEDKIGIIENIYKAKNKRYNVFHDYSSEKYHYLLNRGNWGIEFTRNNLEKNRSVCIGQFYDPRGSHYLYKSYEKTGLFLTINEDLTNDTYNVELTYF